MLRRSQLLRLAATHERELEPLLERLSIGFFGEQTAALGHAPAAALTSLRHLHAAHVCAETHVWGQRSALAARTAAAAAAADGRGAAPPTEAGSWAAQSLLVVAQQQQQQQQVRRYAPKPPKGAILPPGAQVQGTLRASSLTSSNLIAEPYKGTPPPLPWSSLLTAAGWRERWKRLVGKVKNTYALAKCAKHIPGFKVPEFKQEALQLYEVVNRALAQGDLTELRKHTSPRVFTLMKREVAARREAGWTRVHWALAERPDDKASRLCHARLLALDAKQLDNAFVQLTVSVVTRQAFAAYDRSGRLVAGSPDSAFPVEDFWVYERSLQPKAGSRWRVAGRLTLPSQAESGGGGGTRGDGEGSGGDGIQARA